MTLPMLSDCHQLVADTGDVCTREEQGWECDLCREIT